MTIIEATRHDRLVGLLLGGAVGDALGAPIEFMDRSEIVARYGEGGLREFAPAYGRIGAITDDTQMTLFTLEGLIRASVRYASRGICHPPSVIHHAYLRWHLTQSQAFEGEGGRVPRSGWLIKQPELWAVRAPGHTCMTALAVHHDSFGTPANNDSKGAGGIMRVGPIGLYAANAFEMAGEVAALTHGHETSTIASAWFADCIQRIGEGASLRVAIERSWQRCRGLSAELDQSLSTALAMGSQKHAVVPAALGEGWIAEEAAAIACWCALVSDDPLSAVCLAANITGDSDTTASLVGQLMGAAYGARWIPREWLGQLELHEVMLQLASDAVRGLELTDEDAGFEEFAERFPGW